MFLRIAVVAALGFLVASCATPSHTPGDSSPGGAPAPRTAAYEAARAPVHDELFLCRGALAYNTGPVGSRGEIATYTPYIATPAGSLLRAPTGDVCLSSGFGVRATATGGGRNHLGVDLANPDGGFIYAAADGRVASLGRRGDYGLLVEIDHGHGVTTRYGHLAEVKPGLRRGDRVAIGEPIGFMGATGNATGVHLHYEVLIGRSRVDPLLHGS